MKRLPIKICGLKRAEDVELCCSLGANILGFVVDYPLPVPWNLTKAEAAPLLARITAPARSCIVTGGTPEQVVELAQGLRPHLVQLHFRETLEDTVRIAAELSSLGTGVIKTLPSSAQERLEQFGTPDAAACARLLDRTGVFAVLVDSRSPANANQPGSPADLSLYRLVKMHTKKPVILAGGITPESLPGLKAGLLPDMIDVMTGVETSPGVKSPEKLRALLENRR